MRPVAFLLMLLAAAPAGAGEKYIRTVHERGQWWFQDAEGRKFLSRGISGVGVGVPLDQYDPSAPSYCALRYHPSAGAWWEVTAKRMKSWGFNTLGARADDAALKAHGLPYCVALSLGAGVGAPWTDPGSLAARVKYQELVAPLAKVKDDPLLLGICLDGGLGWWDESVFLRVLRQSASKERAKEKLWSLLRDEYRGDPRRFLEDFAVEPAPKAFEDLKGALKRAAFRPGRRSLVVEAFTGWMAERFYSAAVEELKKVDSNHLVISDRYPGYYSQPVVRAAARYVDVIATSYDSLTPGGWASPYYFESLERLARRPVLVEEFSFASAQNRSGDPNKHGSFRVLDSQRDRGAAAAQLSASFARFPGVAGWHWFQYFDQSPGGADGASEDCNTGLVDIKDEPYDEVTGPLAAAAKTAEAGHGTWPAGEGLQRLPQGWVTPQLADLPVVNGELDEWPLARTWVPGVKSAAPFERWGDVYAAWHKEGVALAVVYLD
ncbi:MAG: hypothetical protein AAB368_15365 [bacterium]